MNKGVLSFNILSFFSPLDKIYYLLYLPIDYTEACKLQPSVIEVGLKNKAMMVRKVARRHLEAPLQG